MLTPPLELAGCSGLQRAGAAKPRSDWQHELESRHGASSATCVHHRGVRGEMDRSEDTATPACTVWPPPGWAQCHAAALRPRQCWPGWPYASTELGGRQRPRGFTAARHARSSRSRHAGAVAAVAPKGRWRAGSAAPLHLCCSPVPTPAADDAACTASRGSTSATEARFRQHQPSWSAHHH